MARPRLNDHHDDFDEPRPPRSPHEEASGGMSAVKIVAIVGAVVLTIALMCGGIAIYAIYAIIKTGENVAQQIEKIQKDQEKLRQEQENSDKEKSRQFANGFVQQLREKRAEAAYAMTTAAYQKRVSLEQLKEVMLKQAAVLKQFTGFLADVLAPDKGATYSFNETIRHEGKPRKLSVTAVKQKEAWKVDQFSVEDDNQPKGQ
jgi:hypothetical protein